MISDRNGRLPPAGHETTDPAGCRDPGPVYSFEQRHNRQLLLSRSCLPATQQLWAGVPDGPGETLQSLRADPPIFTTTKISIVQQQHAPPSAPCFPKWQDANQSVSRFSSSGPSADDANSPGSHTKHGGRELPLQSIKSGLRGLPLQRTRNMARLPHQHLQTMHLTTSTYDPFEAMGIQIQPEDQYAVRRRCLLGLERWGVFKRLIYQDIRRAPTQWAPQFAFSGWTSPGPPARSL